MPLLSFDLLQLLQAACVGCMRARRATPDVTYSNCKYKRKE